MDIVEAIKSRKSIRGYKPDPVPREILREILEIATRAPSGVNMQPWEITVLTGKTLDNIRQGNAEMRSSDAPVISALQEKPPEGVYRQRQVELAIQLFKLMGIPREDMEKRKEWQQRGFHYFGAPAAFILSIDRSVSKAMAIFDIGALTQTICLTALNYGLGTCIEGQGVGYAEVIRKFTHLPESKRPIIAIAIGYPDWDFPANKVWTPREPLDNVVTWCGDD